MKNLQGGMHFPCILQNSYNSAIKCAITLLLIIRLNNFPVARSTRATKLELWMQAPAQHDVCWTALK